jgi:hypothetical protein
MLSVRSVQIKEGITHNLLICDPIMHLTLYQVVCRSPDPHVFHIISAGGVQVIRVVFTQYGIGMGIGLDLDETGAPAPNPFTIDLSFTHRLLHVRLFPTSSIACTTECLAC